jgi:DNA-directed RNA polymerase specialized sigma24 family protein
MSPFLASPGLLAAFRAGEREALDTVYRTYLGAVAHFLRALARDSGDPELAQSSVVADLLQDVFVRAFSDTGRRGYDGIREYGPYLKAIARNRFIDARRMRGREVLTSPDDPCLTGEYECGEVPGCCEPRARRVLAVYLRSLEPRVRCVYEHRFAWGFSQKQVSEAIGISRRAIRTIEGELRRGLRKALIRAGISLRELSEAAGATDLAPPDQRRDRPVASNATKHAPPNSATIPQNRRSVG